jgi:hypothetical protein
MNNIQFFKESMLLLPTKTLILSDLHLGYEDAVLHQGMHIPRTFQATFYAELKNTLKKTQPQEIILNGDIQHDFSKPEYHHLAELLTFLKQHHNPAVYFIIGNHDTMMPAFARKHKIPCQTALLRHYFLITHGDQLVQKEMLSKAKTIIIGHVHPTLVLQNDIRIETYKCFLYGTFKRKKLIVMPCANPLIEGGFRERKESNSPYVMNPNLLTKFVIGEKGEIYRFKEKN